MATEAELNALKQGYETNLRQLQALLDAQARLRAVTERTARETRGELERLAEALCPDFVDRVGKDSPLGLVQVTAQEMADAVIRDVQVKLSRLEAAEVAGQRASRKHDDVANENERLRGEVMRLEQELAEMRQKHEAATTRVSALQQLLEDAQRRLGSTPEMTTAPAGESAVVEDDALAPVPPDQLPDWIQAWQQEQSCEQDLALLQVLAETGVARWRDAAKLVGERAESDPSTGNIAGAFGRCSQMALIELVEVESEVSGQQTNLVHLTGKGQDVCRMLLSVEPVRSQATELLARHESPAHAVLTLEVADVLQDAGYTVDLLPGRIELSGGRVFIPDLMASLQGRTMLVVVEQAACQGGSGRDDRWRDYYEATGGEFYVAVPDRRALDRVKSEITFWAGQQELVLWMMPVRDARGKGKIGDDVWSVKRRILGEREDPNGHDGAD
jgi:hypothetical protein